MPSFAAAASRAVPAASSSSSLRGEIRQLAGGTLKGDLACDLALDLLERLRLLGHDLGGAHKMPAERCLHRGAHRAVGQ